MLAVRLERECQVLLKLFRELGYGLEGLWPRHYEEASHKNLGDTMWRNSVQHAATAAAACRVQCNSPKQAEESTASPSRKLCTLLYKRLTAFSLHFVDGYADRTRNRLQNNSRAADCVSPSYGHGSHPASAHFAYLMK